MAATKNDEDGRSGSTAPRCAVVVSTRNRGPKIASLVASVLLSTEPDFEMVIVDQSDREKETAAALEPFRGDRRVKYVHSDTRGTSRGRNLGVAMTSAPVIAITDDDCVVPPDWIQKMLEPFEKNPRLGVEFCNVDPMPAEGLGYTPHIHFGENRTFTSVEEAWEDARHGFVLGAGMAFRRSTFEDLHGFDEALGPGSTFPACEDNDFAWRALIRGWSMYENANVTVMHDGFRSIDQVRSLVNRDCYAAGGAMAKYLQSGHWPVGSLVAWWVYNHGIREPAKDLLSHRIPRGFRRPYWLLQGLAHGLRTPVDGVTLCYRPAQSDKASTSFEAAEQPGEATERAGESAPGSASSEPRGGKRLA